MVQKLNGWVCDICRKFFTHDPLLVRGKKRVLHFCSLKCKGNYLKKLSISYINKNKEVNMSEEINKLKQALRRAAEEVYHSEMIDTNMESMEVVEFAETYRYYLNEDEKKRTIDNCTYETKEDWIKDKINEWINPL